MAPQKKKKEEEEEKSGDDLYKLKAFYQILYQIILCSMYVNYCK